MSILHSPSQHAVHRNSTEETPRSFRSKIAFQVGLCGSARKSHIVMESLYLAFLHQVDPEKPYMSILHSQSHHPTRENAKKCTFILKSGRAKIIDV